MIKTKTILSAIIASIVSINAFAGTSYEVVGQDTGTVQFDYENGGNLFAVIGSNDQTFMTMWSGCGTDSIYAYHDYVLLVSTEIAWDDFPDSATAFANLDWEQRAPKIQKGKYVVFLNEDGQFLACKVINIKDDFLTFEFKIYDADTSISEEIIRVHEEKKASYVSDGKNEGTVRFDFENNCGQFVIIGANGQRFETEWSGCGLDSIYAYRDNVKLISGEILFESLPTNANVFAGLDWEQRAPTIHKGKSVVFLNDSGQFLCCKITDIGYDDAFLAFEFKIYDADYSISEEINRLHEEKKNGYVAAGKNEGTVQFDFANNSGQFIIVGENGQMFRTCWSACGAKSIYAYRDYVKNVGLCDAATVFPTSAVAFVNVERGQRVVTVHEGDWVVFMNDSGQFLCCHVTTIKTKTSDVDEDLLVFGYKIYDADTAVLDAIVATDNTRGESRLSDDFIITADISSDSIVNVPSTVNEDLVKIKIVRIVKSGGSSVKRDITDFLEIPKAENGVIDLTKIQVKAMYASEVFSVERGAKLIFDQDQIHIETANTREGLVYDFYEATDLNNLMDTVKESKIGDGTPFIPNVSTEKTSSRFFAIKVRAT